MIITAAFGVIAIKDIGTESAEELFKKLEYNNAILTYYYRIDPEVSENAKGFWYVRGE